MKTCQILFPLFMVMLVYQVRSEDKIPSSQVFAPFEETVWLNCSTPDPDDTHLESRLKKRNNTKGPNWSAVEVLVDDWEISTSYCMTNGKEIMKHDTVAYALPSNVSIEMEPKLEEGKEYKITCTVHKVAPLEYLTVYITRGGEVISNKSYAGPHVRDRKNVSHSYTFTASRSDNLMNFSCEAVLQLGSERRTVMSSEIPVWTYTLPDPPVISVQEWIEIGTSFTAECLVTNGFPPRDVRLSVFIDDTPLRVIPVVTDDGTVKGTAYGNASYPRPGLRTIRCKSHLHILSTETAMNVTIYELPTVSLSLSRNITDLGEDVTAICDIDNKHPGAYGLSIIVDGKEEQNGTMFTLTRTLTASRRTPHLDITCTAYVIGNSSLSRSATQTLQVHYPPEFTEDLCPSTLTLVEGKTQFSCQADGNPEPTVECSNNGSYINDMVTVTKDMSGSYTCIATNQKGNATKEVNVMVQSLTPDITIDLKPQLEEGKEYTISCSVHEVVLLEVVSIFITRGGEVIRNNSYTGPHVRDRQTVRHSYTFIASRSDNLKNFSCEAVLQFGSERHTVTSSEITAQTYTLPYAPVISVQEWIEIGTSFTAECLVTNGFPPRDVRLSLFIDDTPLHVIPVVTDEETVKGTAYGNASYPRPGLRTIRCKSELFTSSRETAVTVKIYELPTMSLALSRNIIDLGEDVTATCDIANKHPGAYGLSIIVDGQEEQNGTMFTLNHTFTASRRTPHLDITCTAYVIGNSSLSRSSTQTLQVHYLPEFTENLCPSTLVLIERKTHFSCDGDGNPEPTVECSANGSYINDMVTVTRDMSGIYKCEATNQKGQAQKDINVTVQYEPVKPILTVSSNATITKGNPLNITCRSDGSPAPTYSWQIPNNAGVTYSPDNSTVIIHTATSSHSGTYTCVARNVHGGESEKQEVTVVSAGNMCWIIGIVAGVVMLVILAIVVAYWCHWEKKTGSYDVTGPDGDTATQRLLNNTTSV
ncbi:intercellular adhesion molecule 5-like isoform X1 [Dendropsophus ebraccatus]|uniref:intercellular adhesion molecule 5-like isoform X1 n=1 Tax=Dendropsophus ebraccatus TaxID=150705 RepID=UPI0038312957